MLPPAQCIRHLAVVCQFAVLYLPYMIYPWKGGLLMGEQDGNSAGSSEELFTHPFFLSRV